MGDTDMPEIRWEINKAALFKAAIDADLGFSQNKIAESIGTSPASLSRVLRGKTQPSAAMLAQLRLVFGSETFNQIVQAVPFQMTA